MEKTKVIRRGKVHIIPNQQNKLSSITEEGKVRIDIRQIELHVVNGYGKKIVKEHYMEAPPEILGYKLKRNLPLPGNIHVIQQTQPYNDDDHMEALLWRDGKVVRTCNEEPIYEIKWYAEQEDYEPEKEIDKIIVHI